MSVLGAKADEGSRAVRLLLMTNSDIAPEYRMSVSNIFPRCPVAILLSFLHLLCLSIASNASSSNRGEMPSTRNPGKLSEAVVSICISST